MSNIRKQLKNLDVSKLRMKSGRTVENELKHHAGILADAVMEELDAVYSSYSPKIYRRTYDVYNSLYIDDKVWIDVTSKETGLSIGIHFDEGSLHRNFDGEDSNIIGLLNEGWEWNNNPHIPYLSERDGSHFIESAIEKYRQRVSNPFTVKFTINGEEKIF